MQGSDPVDQIVESPHSRCTVIDCHNKQLFQHADNLAGTLTLLCGGNRMQFQEVYTNIDMTNE